MAIREGHRSCRSLLARLYGGDEPIATSRQGLDETGIFGGVAERIAETVHGGIEAVLEVAEGVIRPKSSLQLLSADQLAGPEKQKTQDLKGLSGEAHR
jgi:hypothetical protein